MSLPFWLEPVYDAAGMASADRWAIEEGGIASLGLMEAAGEALARETEAIAGPDPIKVVCGKGNNGGDGFVAARHLAEWGHRVEVLCVLGTDGLSEDARSNFDRLRGVTVLQEADAIAAISGEATFIDAILGTGFSGEPREPVPAVIEALSRASGPIVACDLPTGVNGSTGEASLAVAADLTVTFHGLKVGHLINPGKHLCGPVRVTDIGIPAEAPAGSAAGVIEPDVAGLLPLRGASSTKFSSGRVSVVGGSPGLTGAVCLASQAAARAGAGYVTAAVPATLQQIFEAKLTEVMTVGLADGDAGMLSESALEEVVSHSKGAGAVVIGSGIGRSPKVASLVTGAIRAIDAPIVIDADALSVLGSDLDFLTDRQVPTVLTPHAGEMARLLGTDSSTVEARRLHCVKELAETTGATIVLKGDDTIVQSGETTAINDLASPALATAGTGDVLAGVIAAFMARGLGPLEAASAGVIAHSQAGRIATRMTGLPEGVIASDVIDALPAAVARLADSGRGVE